MSFASSAPSHLRRVPAAHEQDPGQGRATMVAHLDRWFSGSRSAADRAVLLVLDVDLDDALPADEPEDDARRLLLLEGVAVAVDGHAHPGDARARIDAGRFALLRGVDGATASWAAARELGQAIEDALAGLPEGVGARVTVGAARLAPSAVRPGRELLGVVTTTMLEGKLLTDDRLVVVVARD